jgi:hypothetical protein
VRAMEELVRDAFAAAVAIVDPDTIRDAPRAAGPPVRTRRGPSLSWRFPGQVLIPVAAAVAVAVIVTAVTATVPKARPGHQAGHLAPWGPTTGGYQRGRLPGGPPPPFFAGIRQVVVKGESDATALDIYSSATGRPTGSIAPPAPGRYFQAVAALGGGLDFVAAASQSGGPGGGCGTWLYRFSVSSRGRPSGLTLLPVPEVGGTVDWSALAASADGRVIAYSAQNCGHDLVGQVGVIHLGAGKVATWSYRWPVRPQNLSLSANGRLLGFVANPSSPDSQATPYKEAAWTLRTNSKAGPLASRYQKVLSAPAGVQAAVLSPTGAIMFAARPNRPSLAARYDETVGAYDTATGRLIRLLRVVPVGPVFGPLLSADASGHYVLLYQFDLRELPLLDLVTGQLTAVPGSPAGSPVAVAW